MTCQCQKICSFLNLVNLTGISQGKKKKGNLSGKLRLELYRNLLLDKNISFSLWQFFSNAHRTLKNTSAIQFGWQKPTAGAASTDLSKYRHCPHFRTLIFLVQLRFVDTETEEPHVLLFHGTPSFSCIIQGCSVVQQTLDMLQQEWLGLYMLSSPCLCIVQP